jgi:glycosyltransferase involved in cell wall biosynthesis
MIDVAFLIGKFDKGYGGAQQLLYDICRILPDDNFDLTVYHMFGEGNFKQELGGEVNVVSIGADSNYDFRKFYNFVNTLKNSSHDILHTNSTISGVWGRLAAHMAGIETIISVEHNVHHSYRRYSRVANGLTLPLADTVVGVSNEVTRSLQRWEELILSDTKIITIKNGVDIEKIESSFSDTGDPLSPFENIEQTDPVIGIVGRLSKQKGHEYAIRAMPKVKDIVPDSKLLIVGDGPLRQSLENLCHDLGVSDAVVFSGYVQDVYSFYPKFDVALFPSLWEGFGLAPVESMVAGCPIIASDIPTFREVIDDAGILVSTQNPDILASELAELLQNTRKAEIMGKNARKRVEESFNINETVLRYKELYSKMVRCDQND